MQVVYHCTIRTLDGVVVESTRSEHGGKFLFAHVNIFENFVKGINRIAWSCFTL